MDKIYLPSQFPCSEPFKLKPYFQEFAAVAQLDTKPDMSKMDPKEVENKILDSMKIFNKKERKELLKKWKGFQLTVPGECPPGDYPSASGSQARVLLPPAAVPEEAMKLHVVRARLEHRDAQKELYLKRKLQTEPYACNAMSKKSGECNLKPGSDFIISVRVYLPLTPTPEKPKQRSCDNLQFSHEIIALGSNTLADLRDKILCKTDLGIIAEVEHPSELVNLEDVKEKYPSGFLFIENTFYNDTRKETCVDYSEVILEWAKENGIEEMHTAILETTRIEDLTVRFGYPYLYQHQASCEHVFVFSNAWLLSEADSLDKNDYPSFTMIKRSKAKNCIMCGDRAKWICKESDRLPQKANFLCNRCATSYNYNEKGKIGTFKLYPYFEL